MKKYFIFIAVIAMLSACEKKNDDNSIVQHDIMIRGKVSLAIDRNAKAVHLTPKEISKQAFDIAWKLGNGTLVRGAMFIPVLRDTANGILKRWSTDVLNEQHELVPDFIEGKDIVIERYNGTQFVGDQDWLKKLDTIGYVPNSIIKAAHDSIVIAHSKQQWQKIYDIFNEKFVFLPITGPEYRDLMKLGTN